MLGDDKEQPVYDLYYLQDHNCVSNFRLANIYFSNTALSYPTSVSSLSTPKVHNVAQNMHLILYLATFQQLRVGKNCLSLYNLNKIICLFCRFKAHVS